VVDAGILPVAPASSVAHQNDGTDHRITRRTRIAVVRRAVIVMSEMGLALDIG
jgi:hypothetical protein